MKDANGSRGRLTVDRDHEYSRWGFSGVPRCLFVLSHRFPNNGSVKRFVVRQLNRDSLVYSHLAKKTAQNQTKKPENKQKAPVCYNQVL